MAEYLQSCDNWSDGTASTAGPLITKNSNELRKTVCLELSLKNRTYVRKIERYLNLDRHVKHMIEGILDSKTKARIAKLLVESGETLQVSDVARRLGISKSRASECLRDLAGKGVLESRSVGRSVVYNMSSSDLAKAVSSSLTQERRLLSEIEMRTVSKVKVLGPVSFALFGSVALRGLRFGSDIDFILLHEGDIDRWEVAKVGSDLTQRFGFKVSILIMSVGEFRRKARIGEEFVLNVMADCKLLLGKNLEDVVWQEK